LLSSRKRQEKRARSYLGNYRARSRVQLKRLYMRVSTAGGRTKPVVPAVGEKCDDAPAKAAYASSQKPAGHNPDAHQPRGLEVTLAEKYAGDKLRACPRRNPPRRDQSRRSPSNEKKQIAKRNQLNVGSQRILRVRKKPHPHKYTKVLAPNPPAHRRSRHRFPTTHSNSGENAATKLAENFGLGPRTRGRDWRAAPISACASSQKRAGPEKSV
jgi:hypothetical protein